MACNCCNKALNSGMIIKADQITGQRFKSCPHCSDANGSEHVFHHYPNSFGKTPARKSSQNPDGFQSYCIDCRHLPKGTESKNSHNGRLCSTL